MKKWERKGRRGGRETFEKNKRKNRYHKKTMPSKEKQIVFSKQEEEKTIDPGRERVFESGEAENENRDWSVGGNRKRN